MTRRAADALRRLSREEDGQSLVELALLLMLIALVSIAVLQTMGADVRDLMQDAADVVQSTLP